MVDVPRPLAFFGHLASRLWRAGLLHLAIIVGAGLALWGAYQATTAPVLLVLDGRPLAYRTHQSTVGGLLNEIGLAIGPADIVLPASNATLVGGDRVVIQRARSYNVEADGVLLSLSSHAATAGDLLHEAGLKPGPHDQILLEGRPATLDAPLLPSAASAPQGWFRNALAAKATQRPATVHVAVRRAIPFYLHDGTLEGELFTTATTVGQALLDQGIVVYLGDRVNPSLGTRLSAGLNIFVKRSVPVEIVVDGRRIRTRTQVSNVGELLTQEGVALFGKDRVQPAEDTPIAENLAVSVTRVREEMVMEEESIPFETVMLPDAEMEIDNQEVRQAGGPGLTRRRVRLAFEDGLQVARVVEDEWIERQPQNKAIYYGTRIVLRTLDTPDGPITYWRHLRALATAYTAATSGKTRDHPAYGITRMGWQMRHGIIAVDPTVIPLTTQMYVPGYGPGVAGDTGGMIIGRHIDLGYEEDDPRVWLWYRWVDIYLVAPAPPASQIRYVLPNWPREK